MVSFTDALQLLAQASSLLYLFLSNLLFIAVSLPYFVLVNLVKSVLYRFYDPRPPGRAGLDSKLGGAGGQLNLDPVVFYEGEVTHVRRTPAKNAFKYRVRMAVVNLDDPPHWFVPSRNENMDADQARAVAGTDGPVRLLTHPPAIGYVQNPISVYYCYSKQGVLVKGIAEVTNTPWGERVTFLFDPKGAEVPKALHVSPFMDMRNVWKLIATDPTDRISLSVLCTHPEHGAYFDAHFVGVRSKGRMDPNETAGLSSLWRFGYQPQRVAFWIYIQAVILIWKGVGIHAPPAPSYRSGVLQGARNPVRADSGRRFEWREAKAYPWK